MSRRDAAAGQAYPAAMASDSPPLPPALPPADQLEALNRRAASAARLLQLLASPPRLRILCRLGEGECSVNELAHYAGLAQAAASQHLAKLRAEGVVSARREGQTIHYSLTDPAAIRMIDTLCEIYERERARPSRG